MLVSRNCRLRILIIIMGLTIVGSHPAGASADSDHANRPASITASPQGSVEDKLIAPQRRDNDAEQGEISDQAGLPGQWHYWLALAFVIFVIFVAAAILRKATPAGRLFASLPVVEVMGRTYLAPKQSLALVKISGRVILLGLTEHNVTHLLTISEPDEISQIVSTMAQHRSSSITRNFMHLFTSERKGFSDTDRSQTTDNPGHDDDVYHDDRSTADSQLKGSLNLLLDKVRRLKDSGGQL